MQTLRVYDPERRPSNWTEIIRPGQFVAFAKQFDSGAPCDAAGTPFVSTDAITCRIFDSLRAADAFCRARVEDVPTVRFDIFDSAGRAQITLIVAAPVLFWIDWAKYDGLLILPTILGINFLLIAARLFQLNGAYASAEKSRRERLSQHADGGGA